MSRQIGWSTQQVLEWQIKKAIKKNFVAPTSGFLVPSADGTSGSTVYFFGDSTTVGVGATTSADRFSTLLSTAKGWTEVNVGLSGYVITNPGACVARPQWDYATDIPTKVNAYKYMLISFGVNDHFLANSNVTAAQYKAAIQTAIDNATGKGWQNRRIIILPPFWTNFDNSTAVNYCFPPITDATRKAAFVLAAQEAAISKGANFFDVYTYMGNNGGNTLTTDGIHPNDAGYLTISNGLSAYII